MAPPEPNPQPSAPDRELQAAPAGLATEIAQAAITAQAAGLDSPGRIVRRAIDEWCPTPPPLPFPWPEPWPHPWPDPDPEMKVDIGASQVVGALAFASLGARMPAGELRDAFNEGANQLMEAGLSA